MVWKINPLSLIPALLPPSLRSWWWCKCHEMKATTFIDGIVIHFISSAEVWMDSQVLRLWSPKRE